MVLQINRQRDPVDLLQRIIKEKHSFTGEERRYGRHYSHAVVILYCCSVVKDQCLKEEMYMYQDESTSALYKLVNSSG